MIQAALYESNEELKSKGSWYMFMGWKIWCLAAHKAVD